MCRKIGVFMNKTALETIKCPECNGEVELDENQEYGFCKYCGAKLQNKNFKVIKTKVKLDKTGDENILIERGFFYLENNEWEQAESYFNSALDINPKKSKAYIGLFFSKKRVSDWVDLGYVDDGENSYINRAIKYATPKELKEIEKGLQISKTNHIEFEKSLTENSLQAIKNSFVLIAIISILCLFIILIC